MTKRRASTALVRVDDEAQLGPAMRALASEGMRSFVIALVQTGCSTARAAELAGYSASSQNILASRGWQLAHDERVQAALREEGVKALRASGVAGISILAGIASNPQEAARDRIAAVKELLSRGGFGTTTEHNVNVTHRSEGEIDAELLALASTLGFTADQKAKLIGRPIVHKGEAKIIDATFIDAEAEPVENYEGGGTNEGLEDLLPLAEPLGRKSGIASDEDPTIGQEYPDNDCDQ